MCKREKVLAIVAAAIIGMFLFVKAGRREHAENVCLSMGANAYNEIKAVLGEDASDIDVARYYEYIH